ncbi:signal recognition particle-docking protein FtsY [Latilactobacillus curvatus]|uniref:signal recognition particle-docking protein FtsY n=1 Tax=Latilactobacillus curvatus TaxID=28038 RepID=UPI0020C7F151|nr:signal recognition particle-docking protein FtsY [Latilactobacillus curvatus]MCP8859324.1 signal recognition particle-docking protein FtsY [Latilactobacillus curvatus]WRS46718.1 signal recognition particle-docking protein FtsY [Latilactobacillus curvatus]
MGLFDRIKKAFSAEPEKETPVEQDQAIPETPVESDATPVESQTPAETAAAEKTETDEPASLATEDDSETTPAVDTPEEAPVDSTPEPEPEPEPEPVEEVSATEESDAIEEVPEAEETSTGDMQAAETKKYDDGLEKSRLTFGQRLNALFANFRSVDEAFFDDVEEMLIEADVGYETAMKIADELRDEVKLRNVKKPEAVSQAIVEKLVDLYGQEGQAEDNQLHFAPQGELTVFLFVGVNGAGKTTSIGKFAHQLEKAGKKVLLAAGDTFRAGAIEQLQEWGRRDNVPVVASAAGSDPASVVYDAVKRAKEEQFDILLVDTAGRLQNNVNLMKELEKVKRIITREVPAAPQEVLLVLDATTGQNALVQAKQFKQTTDVTGIVLTKLDGSAKGGIVLAVRTELHLPVKMVGLGEQMNDLQLFDPNRFVYGLFKDIIVGDGPQSDVDTDVSQAIK